MITKAIIKTGTRVPKEITYNVDSNGCWNCTSHKPVGRDYPRIRVKIPGTIGNGKLIQIHRFQYEKYKGVIPEGIDVRHTCDNPICCNPEHLILGTHQDNMDDKVDRNRQTKGESHPKAKLKDNEVLDIFDNEELTRRQLSKKYNVSYQTIMEIQHGDIWGHLTSARTVKTRNIRDKENYDIKPEILEDTKFDISGTKYEQLKLKLS